MKLLTIPEGLKGKELSQWLISNKGELVKQKKALIKRTDPYTSSTEVFFFGEKGERVKAASGAEVPKDAGIVWVQVVANTALWMDSQKDVLLPKAANRSIKNNWELIPHLHDHIHTVEAIVGDVQKIYAKEVSLEELGLKGRTGATEAIIFETNIRKDYNVKVFNLYKNKRIQQHSIGLRYIDIELAINDEEEEKYFVLWNKYINKIINKEEAEATGYFWVVSEYQLLENSCVLWGANILTPTLDSKGHSDEDTPEAGPSKDATDLSDKDTSIRNCPDCLTQFNASSGSAQCPGCGKFVNEAVITPVAFDIGKAIAEAKFFN